MNTQNRSTVTPVQIHADHAAQKWLGNWTTDRAVQILVAGDAVIYHRDLAWTGRGQVKQAYRPTRPARAAGSA